MTRAAYVRAWPRDGGSGVAFAVRLAGGGAALPYHRDGEHYRAGLMTEPRFTATLGFGDDGWSGGVVPTATAITFMPGDPALLDSLMAGFWAGAAIEVDVGDEYGALARRLTGVVASATEQDDKLVITAADLSHKLAKPFAADSFAGTGGIEGDAIAEGRTKRRSVGRVFNVEGRVLLAAYNIYEFGDPARPLQGCTALRDMGREGTLAILGWQGSIAATLAALQAAAAPAGGGVFAPSIACAKWWTQPAGPLTADLLGEIGSGYVETVAEIAAAIADELAGLTVDALAAAVALRPYAAGWHVADGVLTGAAMLDTMLGGAGLFWVLDPAGTIQIREWRWDGAAEAIRGVYLGRSAQYAPHRKRKVGYHRNERQHDDGEIAANIPAGDVVFEDGTSIEVAIADTIAYARSRGQLWTGAARPTLAESVVGDSWLDPADGTLYERVGADGITIGGDFITIGGDRIILAWTLSANQAIRDALATAGAAWSAANEAIDGLIGLADDGVLSVNEKITKLIPDQAQLAARYAVLAAQAAGFSVSTSAAAAAKATWDALLAGLAPAWNDIGADTPVARGAFDAARDGFDQALADLSAAIKAKTATLASWSGVSGTGKPADNATVGAPSGTNVGSTPAVAVESGAIAGGNAANNDGTIKDGNVDTPAIVADAVTSDVSFVNYATTYVGMGIPTEVKDLTPTFTVTKHEDDSYLKVITETELKSDNDIIMRTQCHIRSVSDPSFFRTNIAASSWQIISDGAWNSYVRDVRNFTFPLGMPAGTYTITFQAMSMVGVSPYEGGGGAQSARPVYLNVMEVKR